MRLLLKFNLFFLPLMLLGLVGAGYTVREAMRLNAKNEVLQNAQVMMETATAAIGKFRGRRSWSAGHGNHHRV